MIGNHLKWEKKISQKYYKNNWKTLQIIEQSSKMTEKWLKIWITNEKYPKWWNGLKNDEFWEKS